MLDDESFGHDEKGLRLLEMFRFLWDVSLKKVLCFTP